MKPGYQEALEWDVVTWGRALQFWEKTIRARSVSLHTGLEIGARHGGLSGYFCQKYGCHMYCSDVEPPSERAQKHHSERGLQSLITYIQADATRLPFPDQAFDFVIFKSVLGAIGRHDQMERQAHALSEINRVLRKGGMLFFAENLQGSALHQWSRRHFVPWGKTWRYVSIPDLHALLSPFAEYEIRTTGFLSAFIPGPGWLKNTAATMDALLFFLPPGARYVAYGFAKK